MIGETYRAVQIKKELFIPANELLRILGNRDSKIISLEKRIKFLENDYYTRQIDQLRVKYRLNFGVGITYSEIDNNYLVEATNDDSVLWKKIIVGIENVYNKLKSKEFEKEIKSLLFDKNKEEKINE